MPAEAKASPVTWSSSSSTPLSQCSANRVQPMPTMATRSRMPCEPMSAPPCRRRAGGADRSGLPEVVVDAVGGEEPAERHLHPAADGDVLDVDVGQLD